jgi:hypothetical protein
MKKSAILSVLFFCFSVIFIYAQKTETNTNNNNTTVDFKGSSLGDPSKNNENTSTDNKSVQIDFKGSSLGDPSRGTNSGSLVFTEGYNVKSINKLEDLNIKWTLKENNSIKKILIVDLTTDDVETIWSVNDYKESFVNFEKIKGCLLKDFVSGHTYKLNITLNSGENASLDFKYGN